MEKDININTKDILKGIISILLYLILTSIPYDILRLMGINPTKLSDSFREFYIIIYQAILIIILIYIHKDIIIDNFKIYVKNFRKYLVEYFKYWPLMLLLMGLSNLIVSNFTSQDIAPNQESIINLLKETPIYTVISTVIIAPLLEELVFRLSFRKIFNKINILFIFLSGFIFGGMHVVFSLDNLSDLLFIFPLSDLLFIIPYSIPGFILAYTLVKSKNIFVPISIHFLHNSVMILLQLIVLFK